MASLTIRLLGPPQIEVDGQPVSFRRRKVLALLIYLVVEKGMHSRESLMALLWPESSTTKASVTLRGTLSRLRKSLHPMGDPIISDGGNIGFDFEGGVDLDLDWLDSAVLPQTPTEELLPILTLDRGEFLAGFSLPDTSGYDNWAATQREACQRQVEIVYNRLTQQQLADRRSDLAVETGSRWVNRAPFSEIAYRRLMAAQALKGDRPGALRTYAKCRAILQEEFGIEPSRETAVLAEQIERDRVRKMPALDQAAVTPLPQSAPKPSLPFVGRAEEHRQLVDFYHRLKEHGPQVVTVLGAAGVGKTWLLGAFRDWLTLDSPGVEVWQGCAFEMGGRLPYQPVVEAMRPRLDQENAPEDLLDDVWLATLHPGP